MTCARGEVVLRIQPEREDAALWTQQLRVLRRAAEAGVAPPILHVDEGARAIVSRRVAGVPLAAALGDPAQRNAAIAGVVEGLRKLHGLDPTDVAVRDAVAYVRAVHAVQRKRPGFPSWADALEPRFDAFDALLAADPRRVVSHNDMNPGNILWDGAQVWLVDWEVSGLAHPFYDLATFAMFLNLDGTAAGALLAAQERRPIDERERATFAELRRLAALLCGVTFLGLVPDLAVQPAAAPTLPEFYAAMRAGKLALGEPAGQAAFGLALLRAGTEP